MMMLLCTFQWSMKEEKHTIDMMVKYSNFQTSAVELASLEQRKSDSLSSLYYCLNNHTLSVNTLV
jgi:hypothetical protein